MTQALCGVPTWSFHSPSLGNLNVISNSFCVKTKFCCRKGDPFQGLKLGFCLTLRNELSEGTRVLTKQDILLGKGTRVGSSRVREPRRTALPHGSQSRVLWWWDCLWPIILTQSPSWWCMHCSAKMDASKKDSGRWSNTWCLLLTFPELFLLVVNYSAFLTRTSSRKTAHANGYYGAWPGWAVSVSVLPLTAVLFATGRKQKQPRCPSMK